MKQATPPTRKNSVRRSSDELSDLEKWAFQQRANRVRRKYRRKVVATEIGNSLLRFFAFGWLILMIFAAISIAINK